MSSGLRRISLFVLGFFLLWTFVVFVLWRNLDLSDDLRKLARVVFWLGAVMFWLAWMRPARPMAWLGIWPVSRRAALWTLAAFALVIGWNIARAALAGGSSHLHSAAGMAWGLVGVVEEELVFRGVVQTALVSAMPTLAAIVISAVLFLAIHVPGWLILDFLPDTATIASVFGIGLVCGALRHWGRSLWPAIGAHWANNLGAQL